MTGKKIILDSTLTAIADAIRAKTGKTGKLTPAQMKTEVGTLSKPSGTKTVNVSANGTRTENVKAYESVKIQTNVSPSLTQLTATENGYYNPGTYGADGFDGVTVNVQSGGGGGDEAPVIILAQNGPKSATSATAKTSGSTAPTSLSGLFAGWENLAGADMSGIQAGQVTDISYLFAGCGALQSLGNVQLPTSGFPTVQNAMGVFSSCGFTSLDPTSVINGAEDISSMAENNGALLSINFGAGCLSDVERAKGMLSMCCLLESVSFANTGLTAVESMQGAFSECQSLATIDFSGCDFSHITNDPDEGGGWDYIFEGCMALADIRTDGATVFPDVNIDLSATAVLTTASLQNIQNVLPQSQNGSTLTLNTTVYNSADPNVITMIENKGWTVASFDPYGE